MFDVGFTELVLVFVLGLLVLGPERLPAVAAQIGRWVGRARRTASQLRRQLEREIELSEFTQRRSVPPLKPKAPSPAPKPAAAVGNVASALPPDASGSLSETKPADEAAATDEGARSSSSQ
jgi:sec-independent protein translocase protein TatB